MNDLITDIAQCLERHKGVDFKAKTDAFIWAAHFVTELQEAGETE